MKYFINSKKAQKVSPVLYAVQIMPDGNVVSFRVDEWEREQFSEYHLGVGVRTERVGKYTVMYSRRAKSCGKPMNYLASRFCRIKIYGDAYVFENVILGVPLLFRANEADECMNVLDGVFVRKRRV